MKKIVSIFIVLLSGITLTAQQSTYNGHAIEPGKIIIKYSQSLLKSSSCENTVDAAKRNVELYLSVIGASQPVQKFPKSSMPVDCRNCVDISTLYECQYAGTLPLEKVIATITAMEGVEYAEPSYVSELLYTIDDTEYTNGNLWHLTTCKVLDAWDVEEGDTTVVIGILDGGIDILHKDLINRIAYNTNDPINGLDDDADGYIDNYRGWDIADDDNNPSYSATEHGIYVSGIASAEVNNTFGSAGVGNKTKFLPIKVCQDGSSSVTGGYDAIIYAANQGCAVINCSWGDVTVSSYGKTAVDYATNNCNALVVAAAGNSGTTDMYYPASYDNVLSVGGSIAGDFVWAESSKGTHYNRFVDLCAPAKGYYSLAADDKTFPMSGGGTSFSTPIVSGAAALVKSKYPEYSAIQVGEQLRVTSDDMYSINTDEKYQDMLGYGRLNVYKALTDEVMPSIRVVDMEIEHDSNLSSGDEVVVNVTFKNYLHNATNVTIEAEVEEATFAATQTSASFDTWAADEEKTVSFVFTVTGVSSPLFSTYFKFITTADNTYRDYEYKAASFGKSYVDFEIGNIKSTATFDGSIAVYSIEGEENGFVYKDNENCVFQAGVVLAENQSSIYSRSYWAKKFTSVRYPHVITSDSCDFLIHSAYAVSNIGIDQYIYAWEDVDALLYEFRLTNNRDSSLYDLRMGLYTDWDLLTSSYNQVWYIDSLHLSAVASVDPRTIYVGWQPLTRYTSDVYAFDVNSDVIYMPDGFSNNELWYVLNTSQKTAGMSSVAGAEIAAFNYSLIDTLPAGKTRIVRYAMLAAESKDELYATASSLKQQYVPDIEDDEDVAISSIGKKPWYIYNEEGIYTLIYEPSKNDVIVQIHSVSGSLVDAFMIPVESQSGRFSLPQYATGLYIMTVRNGEEVRSYKITVQ